MSRFSVLSSGVVLLLFAGLVWSYPRPADDYLTKDGKLKHALELREGMEGGPGRPHGRTLRIEPSGEWQITGDWGVESRTIKGKLSRKQLAALARQLATQDFLGLPAHLRGPGFVGDVGFAEHYVSLRFGDKTTHVAGGLTLDLGDTGDILAAPRGKDEQARVSTMVQVIRFLTESTM